LRDLVADVITLTLVAARPTAPGPNDPDLPEHFPALMSAALDSCERGRERLGDITAPTLVIHGAHA
jgi:hypothetical protein